MSNTPPAPETHPGKDAAKAPVASPESASVAEPVEPSPLQNKEVIKEPAAPLTLSLKDALKERTPAKKEEDAPDDSAEAPDEAVGEKLTGACVALREWLAETRRSRLAIAFARPTVNQNRVRLAVPNENLRNEVEQHALDLKKRLMEISGVRCPIEFEVAVEADLGPQRPVSSEDRLKFLVGLNPHLTAFKQALDLDIE